MKKVFYMLVVLLGFASVTTSCNKKGCTNPLATNYNSDATKDDGSCEVPPVYTVPTTYDFTRNGNSTVSFGGQTDRLNQLGEMVTLAKSGTSTK